MRIALPDDDRHLAESSAPQPLQGEEHLGGGGLGSVEHAVVGFAFGVAQPRIRGRCVPVAG
ncbi:hypothetical protein [Agromyces ramosus]|uniref:Uncharacterized protein n=1 Tax=Agromyces ramosus TaxID=33879 RepID=A0ABU0R3R4_9MICO|nr:hypothetical protein [Agromyces ramosus]MDQ0892715.1 hypothetical protein [Agromyces ramosus]